MSLKTYKPYTPSTRQKTTINFSILTKNKPEKALCSYYHRKKGRNSLGHITIRHKGGGHKRLYRFIDFKRDKYLIEGKVIAIEYDPNRNSNLALIEYADGERRYILHINKLKIDDSIISGKLNNYNLGNSLPLKYIPSGLDIHNIELYSGHGGQLIRSAGTGAKILGQEGSYSIIRLSSKEIRLIHNSCFATIGRIGNLDVSKINLGKAGRKRWIGIRPTVRGSAMNAVDHPHGGGEGRCPIGKSRPLTPWGKSALGMKTRKKKKLSNKYILKSR
jgi:large subunit ribosomal protein L2